MIYDCADYAGAVACCEERYRASLARRIRRAMRQAGEWLSHVEAIRSAAAATVHHRAGHAVEVQHQLEVRRSIPCIEGTIEAVGYRLRLAWLKRLQTDFANFDAVLEDVYRLEKIARLARIALIHHRNGDDIVL